MMRQKMLGAIAIALSLITSCAPQPPKAPPDYSTAPPAISTGFHVESQVSTTVELPRAEFLAWMRQARLSDFLTPVDGMPAVENTVMLEGDEWGSVGDRRRVELADGHYAVETILENTDDRLRYQVWGFTNQAGRFSDYATGNFMFADQGDTTHVTWTYRFHPSSFAGRLPLSLFAQNTFQPFMENGLANMKKGAESAQR